MPSLQRREGYGIRSLTSDPLTPRTLSSTEYSRRHKEGASSLVDYAPSRNGQPLRRPYVHDGSDEQAAALAWNRVAAVQAQLRGEPPPPPVPEPWDRPRCLCGYRFRCECPEVPGDP